MEDDLTWKGFYDFLFQHLGDLSRIWVAGIVSLQPGFLRLSQWTKDFHHNSQKQKHASIWIRLVALPREYWREQTSKEIVSALGTPISLDAPTRNWAFGHYARILVDIDLSKRVFDEILVEREGFAINVEVQYERRPLFCHHCYVIGHNVMTCKWLHPEAAKENRGTTQVAEISKKCTLHHCGDKGAYSFGTFQYVTVLPPAAAMEVIKKCFRKCCTSKRCLSQHL